MWLWPDLKILHYQYEKPWQDGHAKSDKLQPLIDLWWQVFEGGTIPDDLPSPFTGTPKAPDR